MSLRNPRPKQKWHGDVGMNDLVIQQTTWGDINTLQSFIDSLPNWFKDVKHPDYHFFDLNKSYFLRLRIFEEI